MSSTQPETGTRAGQPPQHLLALLCRAGRAGSKGPQQQLSALWTLRDPLRRPTCALLADLMSTLLEQSEGAALRDLLANRWVDPHCATCSYYLHAGCPQLESCPHAATWRP